MKREGSHKKLQTSMEYILILSVVVIMALLVSLLVMHNSSNVKLGNSDTLLAVAYFSGANGQPICNATEGESQCFEILLTQPLPKYPTYNLTYWNEKDPSSNYTFEYEQDNYFICFTSPLSNQFDVYSAICNFLDNYGNVNYIGQVNGYYEYIMNASGLVVNQPVFVSSLELLYYSPNLVNLFSPSGAEPSNTTYILPSGGGIIPVKTHLNATSLINIVPEQTTQTTKFDNVLSVTEVGLASGSSLSYSEAFSNGTTTSNSFSIPSNSESTFVISNLTNQVPETVTLSLTGITNGVTVGNETLTTSDNDNVFVNFTQPSPIKLISTTSTVGPFVVTTNRDEPFSNLVITTGNTLANNGHQIDDAYITNMTSNHVEFFIKNPANVIYMNFNFSYNLNSSGPTGEAPNPAIGDNPNGPYDPYDDGAIVFANYTNFTGPSSGTFGTENTLEQNTIITTNVPTSGPFTFSANGNQTYTYTINNGFILNAVGSNNAYEYENLYLPITASDETYILGGMFASGGNTNIGIVNSTNNNDYNAVWLNGLFARASYCAIWFYGKGIGGGLQTPGPDEPSYSNYYPNGCNTYDTFSTYSLNGNNVTIAFPVSSYSNNTLYGSPKYFVIESSDGYGPFYYLAETTNPVKLEICNSYSASNTITCST